MPANGLTGDQCLSPIAECDTNQVVFCIFYRSLCVSISGIVYLLLPFPGGGSSDWRVPPCLVGLACHRPCRPPPPWLLPLLLHLLLLLGHPRLSLLLLQGVSSLPILPSYSIELHEVRFPKLLSFITALFSVVSNLYFVHILSCSCPFQ